MNDRALEQLATQPSGPITHAQVLKLEPRTLRATVNAGWLEVTA